MDGLLRRAGIGANLRGENLAAQLKQRNYPEAAIGLILGGTPLEI
ncbi:MAG TPA: hypothetical protein VFS81_19010 [Candidatus Binatia bacterium]|jgi:hypothetical protein|nr:hypothetical protein [Candidatus Binatia bacterium]